MSLHNISRMRPNAAVVEELARKDLFFFVWLCFNELHPGEGQGFIPNWHVRAICHALQRVATGECRRLLITVPPRHLKSICTAVGFTAWMLGRDPTTKFMVASYGSDLAGNHSRDCRTVMESDLYRRMFPRTRLQSTRELDLRTTLSGHRKAVSLGGPGTGLGGDILIIDDLMKAADASSEAERQRAKEYFEQTLLTRLNNQQSGRIIAIQQRLHEDDIAAHLIGKGTFEHLNLTAIAEADEEIAIGPGRAHLRRKGEALFPQQQPLETLEQMRLELGPVAFSAQYQQNPTVPGGNRIRWEWWGSYEGPAYRSDYSHVIQSWDTGFSSEPTSDFSVCTTWGYRGGKWSLLDIFRDRLDYGDLKEELLRLMDRWRADGVIIESAGSGIILYRELIRECKIRDTIHPYLPRVDKRTRLETQMAKIETGNFLLPQEAPWLEAFKRECQAFPNGRNDDQVDSLSQFLDWLGTRRGLGFVDRAKRARRR